MKKESIKMPKNVLKLLDKCSKEVGKEKMDMFHGNTWFFIQDHDITSPIEQLFYVALQTVQHLNGIEDADPIKSPGSEYFLQGLDVSPQHEIGKYRVDFLVSYHDRHWSTTERTIEGEVKQLIVECDSQEFHERSERERRYEKARDRYLLSKGYKVFHYTGKEIIEKSLELAVEVISELTHWEKEHLMTDSNIED